MGKLRNYKKLLLPILGTIIATLIIDMFYNNMTTGAVVDSRGQQWTDEVSQIAFKASEYWRTPSALGGGSESFEKLNELKDLGIDLTNLKGIYLISDVSDNEFKLTSSNVIEGSIVHTSITYQGIASLPTISALNP